METADYKSIRHAGSKGGCCCSVILIFLATKATKILKWSGLAEKMAIILPTGQWYAPSAVINDVWYCMVLYGIA